MEGPSTAGVGECAALETKKDEQALKDEHIKNLKQKIGELVIDIDILKEAQKPYLCTLRGRPTSEVHVSRALDAQDLQGVSDGSLWGESSQG